MNENINVLIAEDLRNAQEGMEEALKAHEDVNLLPAARDGIKTIEALQNYSVDLLLLDLVLAEIDGIGVLRNIQDMKEKPTVVLVTALSSPVIINQAAKLGAVHTLLKPSDPHYLANRALEVYRDASAQMLHIHGKTLSIAEVQRMIVEALHSVGMPPQLLGYVYLRAAIMLAIQDSSILHGITTVLYPEIAKQYDSSPQKVERSIRHAIETTWARTSTESLQKVFGYNNDLSANRPTNSEFIAMMTDYVITQMIYS